MPWQKALAISTTAFVRLYDYLVDNYKVPVLKASHTNQDPVERTFAVLKSMGNNRRMSDIDMGFRVRNLILGAGADVIVDKANVQFDENQLPILNPLIDSEFPNTETDSTNVLTTAFMTTGLVDEYTQPTPASELTDDQIGIMENSDVTSNETNIVLQIPDEVTEILADADLSSFENQVPTPMEMGKNFETIAV